MNKQKVYKTYEEIVDWFDQHQNKTLFEKEYLDLIVKKCSCYGFLHRTRDKDRKVRVATTAAL